MIRHTNLRAAIIVAAVLSCPWTVGASAQGASGGQAPRLETNEAYIDEVRRTGTIDIKDPMSVLSYVLATLPDQVKVYPTENYYYFKFYHDGQRYAGNLRLDVIERDGGKVNFAYFKDLTEWTEQAPVVHRLLSAKDGVKVERLGDLLYAVGFKGRTVRFALNDLRHVRPAAGALGEGERFIGPVFDESGVQFLLVYNSRLKIFHYVLDERVPNVEPLVVSPAAKRLWIGQRTGFAYYDDHKLKRKILVGVHESNARVNNYFDGPFDQLPDNFIEGEALRSAILEVEPRLKGRIDRFGISPGGADRYMIAPYLHYRFEQDLLVFDDCAHSNDVPAGDYHACFVVQEEGGDEAPPRLAVTPRPAGPRTGKQAAR